MLELPEEVYIVNNTQKRGTTFPILIKLSKQNVKTNALLDTGATRSCMNYSTAHELERDRIKPFNQMQVVGVDGSNLGVFGTLQCKIEIGDTDVQQTFIVCKHLRRNVILGTDFTKSNYAGVSWTKQGIKVLLIKGIQKIEVKEDELGIPVTTKHHVKVPPRYNVVFEVNLHGKCKGTQIISPNKQLIDNHPDVFQHEISIKPEGNKYFPLVAVSNLYHANILYIAKGDIVGFRQSAEVRMKYIETIDTIEVEESENNKPYNWIPARR